MSRGLLKVISCIEMRSGVKNYCDGLIQQPDTQEPAHSSAYLRHKKVLAFSEHIATMNHPGLRIGFDLVSWIKLPRSRFD